MHQNDWLERSTVYSQQHNHFYRWVLYPVSIFFILLLLFLTFGTSEVVIRSTGQLTPSNTEIIQVPVDLPITDNMLEENKHVHRGDILVQFDTTDIGNEIASLKEENNELDMQIKAAEILVESLNQNEDLFNVDDKFGYRNQLKALFAEEESSEYLSQQSQQTDKLNLEEFQKRNTLLQMQIDEKYIELTDWENARLVWNTSQSIKMTTSEISIKIDSWKKQLSLTAGDQQEQFKVTINTTIADNISQTKSTINQLLIEKSNLSLPNNSNNQIKSQEAIVTQSKEQLIASVREKIQELTDTCNTNAISLKNLENQKNKSTIVAPIDGILHLNNEVKDQKEVQKDTILAEIYPIEDTNSISFIVNVPASEISQVKKGMSVNFKLESKAATVYLKGALKDIPANSITDEQGSFYECTGVLKTEENFDKRYGLIGEVSMIVAKKTYLNQIIEIMKN